MNAYQRVRLRRATRFGLFGAWCGVCLMLIVLALTNLAAYVEEGHYQPRSVEEAFVLLRNTAIYATVFAAIAFVIGGSTARSVERKRAWQILGCAMIATGIFLPVYVWTMMWPDWLGKIMIIIVGLLAIGAGGHTIHDARRRAIDNL